MNSYAKKVEEHPDISKKIKVRDFIITQIIGCNKIIGLAGPNINEYIDWCKTNYFRHITIYENDNETLRHQLQTLKKSVKLIFGDITNTETKDPRTFYDLDFCCTIKSVEKKLFKFKDKSYMATFSLRPVGTEETIKRFFNSIEETPHTCKEFNSILKYRIYTTNNQKRYLFTTYRDSSAMCCIAKLT